MNPRWQELIRELRLCLAATPLRLQATASKPRNFGVEAGAFTAPDIDLSLFGFCALALVAVGQGCRDACRGIRFAGRSDEMEVIGHDQFYLNPPLILEKLDQHAAARRLSFR